MKPLLSLSAMLLAAILLAGAAAQTDPDTRVDPTIPYYTNLFPYTNTYTSWGSYLPLEIQWSNELAFSLSRPITNHYSNLLGTLSITPLTNRCSLCGEQHHERHVCHYEYWDTLTVEIFCQGQTSTPQIWMGPRESRIVTQTVARTHLASLAPMPPPLNWTNIIHPFDTATNGYINLQAITPR